MNLDAVYLTYWSIKDPLTQSQSLPVLQSLGSHGYRRLALITYEQPSLLSEGGSAEIRLALRNEGVHWFSLRYHRRPRMLATLWDILQGICLCLRLSRRHGVSVFHSRGTVMAAPAFVAAKLSGANFFYDTDGPLSEEYADAGLWSKTSLSYRLTRCAERQFLRAADRVAVLSHVRKLELERSTTEPITVLPCAVDTTRFRFNDEARTRLRQELGLRGTVMVYAGKWGGWYATEEMMDFVASVRKSLPNVQLLILTQDAQNKFREAATSKGIEDILILRRVPWQSIPEYLSAADVGLSFIHPLPSKKACSPVKNGEYLACGLPIISTAGIGDYSEIIDRENVGVVVSKLSQEAYRNAARAMTELLLEPQLRSRCRMAAKRAVGLAEVVVPRYLQIYQGLFGHAAAPAKYSEHKGPDDARPRINSF